MVWARFGADYIAYYRNSGQTHFLNAASYSLLQRVLAEPQDLESICAEFQTHDLAQRGIDHSAEIRGLLDHLEELGLVEVV